MKKISLLLFIFIISFASCRKKQQPEQKNMPEISTEWATINKEDYTVRYPKDWDMQKFDGTEFCLLSKPTSDNDTFRDNVNLIIENLLEEINSDKYVSLALKNIGKKYKSVSKKKYTTNGQDYFLVILHGDDGLILNQCYRIKNKKAYILTFTYEEKSPTEIKSAGENILISFTLR